MASETSPSVPSVSSSTSEQAIKDCLTTYRICRATATHGTHYGGVWASGSVLNLLNDCAEMNLAVVELLSRGSQFSRNVSHLCAEISETCAEALAPHEHADAQLRVAYAACRRSHLVCAYLSGALPEEEFVPRDVALQGTFPASDPVPPPTEL
ncbi:MAG TPA: hypothetical protein VKP65_24575 [Rhodothermales bacterium]|nr:hypothetical protein [Rhodothermales bacterium]